MPPVIGKKTWKEVNAERKTQRKKWKEQKLLKKAGFQKGIEEVEDDSQKHVNDSAEGQTIINSKEPQSSQNSQKLTVSIAVPGSILSNAQSAELKTYLAGQIARAACIYNVDEVVIFDDQGNGNNDAISLQKTGINDCLQLARILQYLECPQYLRKHIFPLHKDLEYAGLLNPLETPHHLRQNQEFSFREGVVTNHLKKEKGSYVNVGLLREVCVDKHLIPGIRVTVRLHPCKGTKKRYGEVVSPLTPKKELGIYWGYTVRLANSLSDIFAKCPYEEGYDFTIGTSDKGESIKDCSDLEFSSIKHVLIVFGGLQGLETALDNDDNLQIGDVSLLFDKYLNTCVNQGTRTIRTEEAILITLAQFADKFSSASVPNEL